MKTEEEESIDKMWLIARSLKDQNGKYDYKIQKNDAIKLGRVRFRVRDFRCEKNMMSDVELYKSELKEAMNVERFVETTEEVKCRICWDNYDVVENPLISACICKGSVGLVHFRCLR